MCGGQNEGEPVNWAKQVKIYGYLYVVKVRHNDEMPTFGGRYKTKWYGDGDDDNINDNGDR